MWEPGEDLAPQAVKRALSLTLKPYRSTAWLAFAERKVFVKRHRAGWVPVMLGKHAIRLAFDEIEIQRPPFADVH